MTVKGSVTAEVFCDFLKRLVKGMDQKIFFDFRQSQSSPFQKGKGANSIFRRKIRDILFASVLF